MCSEAIDKGITIIDSQGMVHTTGYHPPLKTGEEIRADLKKVKQLTIEEVKQEFWLKGYDKGYEAGRDAETKRNIELIRESMKDRK